MSFKFDELKITKINTLLHSQSKEFDGGWTWTLKSQENTKPMVFSVYTNIDLGGVDGALVSVQTRHGYYELHGINDILFFEPDEVIFVQYNEHYFSCLIIGSENSCSLYSNIRRDLIKCDFSDIHPAVLLAAMQLSITEGILN